MSPDRHAQTMPIPAGTHQVETDVADEGGRAMGGDVTHDVDGSA